jgi:hypothetical protein
MNDYISREVALKKLQMQLLDLEVDQDKGEYSELCENRGARDALDEAIYDIRTIKAADVQPVNQWISVKDRQPQENGFYLTYYSKQIHVSQWFISANWYNEHGGNVTNNVKYWKPLPELPKDGDTNG